MPSKAVSRKAMSSAEVIASPLINPFDAPGLLGQILIDVPRKVAQPVVWERRPSPPAKAEPVPHHHRHVQIAAPGVGQSQAIAHSDQSSQSKSFYNSDSAVFPRSAVPAIAPELPPDRLRWDRHLQSLGPYLRQQRQRRTLSLATLSHRTYVPVHHLVSLETGAADQLPAPVYVRGFIQRIAQDLELDVTAVMNTLPPLPLSNVVPPWLKDQSPNPTALALRSWHLYLGYSAVLAGSLAWVAQDLQPTQVPLPTSFESSQDATVSVQTEGFQDEDDLSSFAPPEAIQP